MPATTKGCNPPTLADLDPATLPPRLSIAAAGRLAGWSPARSYRAARNGTLPTVPAGPNRREVNTVDLLRMLGLDAALRPAIGGDR